MTPRRENETPEEYSDRYNLEVFARRIAAKKMNLQDDSEGAKLPDDLWQQCIPQAERMLSFKVTQRSRGYYHVTVSGICPLDATAAEVRERFYDSNFGGREAWAEGGRFSCIIHTG